MLNIVDIAQLYDLEIIAASFGVKLRGTGSRKVGLCPFPNHRRMSNTPSLSIYTFRGIQKFKCHGNCGAHGDSVDFVGFMTVRDYDPLNFNDRLRAMANLQNKSIDISPPKIEHESRILPEFIWRDFLPISDNIRTYLHNRGIKDETIERFKFGSAQAIKDGRPLKGQDRLLSIPTFHFNTLVGIKVRTMTNTKSGRYFSVKNSRAGLFNFDEVYLTDQTVLIAKGELCAAAMAQEGFLACAMVSGERGTTENMPLFEQIRSALLLAKKIVVADNDALDLAQMRADLFDGIVKAPPKEFKDWDEWLLAKPDECRKETERWIIERE